jgi:hypothetical protein
VGAHAVRFTPLKSSRCCDSDADLVGGRRPRGRDVEDDIDDLSSARRGRSEPTRTPRRRNYLLIVVGFLAASRPAPQLVDEIERELEPRKQ